MKEKEKKGSHLDAVFSIDTARLEYLRSLFKIRPDSFRNIEKEMPGGVPVWFADIISDKTPNPDRYIEDFIEDYWLMTKGLLEFIEEDSRMQHDDTDETADIRDGIKYSWLWALGTREGDFRKKAKDSFDFHLEQYIKYCKKEMKKHQRFKQAHFEWLVRRTVNPIETQGAIASDYKNRKSNPVDMRDIGNETRRLADFIGLTLPK